MRIATIFGFVAMMTSAAATHAMPTVYFSDNFNSYSGIQSAVQNNTGYTVAYDGTLTNWTSAGFDAIHAVTPTAGDWELMFYTNNTITSRAITSANTVGSKYALTFNYGTGSYNSATQSTIAGNGLIVTVLDGSGSVLATQQYVPGAWAPGNYDLQAGLIGQLSYSGDGIGNVSINVATINPGSNTFGGSIDNIALADALSVPEPASIAVLALAAAAIIARRRRS